MWNVLGEHPTLVPEVRTLREQIEARVAAPLNATDPGLAPVVLDGVEMEVEQAVRWILRRYPNLERKAPTLPLDALAYAVGTVLFSGTWEAGREELLQRARWAIHPVVAEVWRTTRAAHEDVPAQDFFVSPSRTALEQTGHLWSSTDAVQVDDERELATYVLRVPPGATPADVRGALEAALGATKGEIGPAIGRRRSMKPVQYRQWMDRYRDWWTWDKTLRARNKPSHLYQFAMERAGSDAAGIWSLQNAQNEEFLREAREWLHPVDGIEPPSYPKLPPDSQ